MSRAASESKPVHSRYSRLSQAWRTAKPIRIISAVSNWFRRRTSHELNSLNLIRLMWSTASEPGLSYVLLRVAQYSIRPVVIKDHESTFEAFTLNDFITWLKTSVCCSNQHFFHISTTEVLGRQSLVYFSSFMVSKWTSTLQTTIYCGYENNIMHQSIETPTLWVPGKVRG